MSFDLPQVAVNFAMTWDGRISTRNKTPANFSSPKDKRRLLEIRASGDAILAGMTTVRVDQMQMGLPDEALRAERVQRGKPPYPLRVLASNSGRVDPSLRVFQADFSQVIVFSTTAMPHEFRESLAGKATLHLTDAPKVDLRAMLRTLRNEYAVARLVCEGGPKLFRSLLEERLVDEINLTLCPLVFGGTDAPTLTGGPGDFLPTAEECDLERMETAGGECFLRYRIRKP